MQTWVRNDHSTAILALQKVFTKERQLTAGCFIMINPDFFFFFQTDQRSQIIVLKELEGIPDRFLNHLPLLSLVKLQLLWFSEGKDHGN